MNFITKKIHDRLIGHLKKQMDERLIDVDKRIISFGLYGIQKAFFDSKDNAACYVLGRWFGYKFYEDKVRFGWIDRDGKPVDLKGAVELGDLYEAVFDNRSSVASASARPVSPKPDSI